MSTNAAAAALSAAIAAGTLHEWVPTGPLVGDAGTLYLASPAHGSATSAWVPNLEPLRMKTHAMFDTFVEEGEDAHWMFDDSSGRLGIAQLKVMAPKPGVRLIGGFVDTVTFVGLRLYLRSQLPYKPTGQPGVINYRALWATALADWNKLLPGIPPVPMKNL